MAPFSVLLITPEAAWIGCDLAEAYPVETWWERLWQNRSYSIAIRDDLAQRAIKFALYGSKDAMTPPVLDDVNSQYREEHNVMWIRVDYLGEEDV